MSRLSIEADLAAHKCERCQKFGHSEDYCPKARAVRLVLAQRFETVDTAPSSRALGIVSTLIFFGLGFALAMLIEHFFFGVKLP